MRPPLVCRLLPFFAYSRLSATAESESPCQDWHTFRACDAQLLPTTLARLHGMPRSSRQRPEGNRPHGMAAGDTRRDVWEAHRDTLPNTNARKGTQQDYFYLAYRFIKLGPRVRELASVLHTPGTGHVGKKLFYTHVAPIIIVALD